MAIAIEKATDARLPLHYRFTRYLRSHFIPAIGILGLIYLFLPIAVVFAFSFNDRLPNGRGSVSWVGFSTDAWTNICVDPNICRAVGTSLQIGVLATLAGTLLGTMIAFALVRHRFRGRQSTNLTIFLPMATPEIVLGASLLSLFLVFKINPGFWPTVIAHVMFCISFVVVTVKARIASLDPRLEQAAMDLYANEFQTFRRVTLPLVAPGIAGAALLAFSLSFDDFIITNFNSGTVITFPKFVYTAAARGIPAQANVIGSGMFFLALAIVIAGQILNRRKAR